jgi:hypothetical protein
MGADNMSLEFNDISDEVRRQYDFHGGESVVLESPLKLNVSESGGHRILTADGVSHYIPAGWIHLSWTVKEGAEHFSF